MALPINPSGSALPPVAQFLAEAALQRQSALLGSDRPGAAPALRPAAAGSNPSGRSSEKLPPCRCIEKVQL